MKGYIPTSTANSEMASPVDWSEFNLWCFMVQDCKKATHKLKMLHEKPTNVRGRVSDETSQENDHSMVAGVSAYATRLQTNVSNAKIILKRLDESHGSSYSHINQFAAGALGGGTATYSTHWLDTIKVKMQTFPQLYTNGTLTLRSTLHHEGLRGLYQGATPAVLGQTAKSAIVFTAYGLCEELVCALTGHENVVDLPVWEHAAAGAATGIIASFVLCPLELLKCRLQALQNGAIKAYTAGKQTQTLPFERGRGLAMTRDILRREGVRGLYRGLPGIWVKEIPGSFIYFGSYEAAKSFLQTFNETEHLGPRGVFLCGVIAGLCFCITHPIETIKTRVQVMSALANTGGFLRTGINIIKTEGIKPLCSGMKPTMLRACLYSGIQFMVFEKIKDYHYENHEKDE